MLSGPADRVGSTTWEICQVLQGVRGRVQKGVVHPNFPLRENKTPGHVSCEWVLIVEQARPHDEGQGKGKGRGS